MYNAAARLFAGLFSMLLCTVCFMRLCAHVRVLPQQLIKGNTFGGTAFASYGAFWMGWFLLEYLSITNKAMFPGVQSGKSLWCGLWAVLTFGFFIVTLRKNGCLMTIFRWAAIWIGHSACDLGPVPLLSDCT